MTASTVLPRRGSAARPLPPNADRGEQQPVPVEVQLQIAHKHGLFRTIERRELSLGANGREYGDFVVESDLAQVAIALEIDRQAVKEPDSVVAHEVARFAGDLRTWRLLPASARLTSISRSKSNIVEACLHCLTAYVGGILQSTISEEDH